MRFFFLFSYLGLVAFSTSVIHKANANDPKKTFSLDTGEEEQVVAIDPITLWPEKVIIDSSTSSVMLVWFHEQEPKSTTIRFSEVRDLYVTPRFMENPSELTLNLNDGRRFLMAVDKKVKKQSLLLAASLGKLLKNVISKCNNAVMNVSGFVLNHLSQ